MATGPKCADEAQRYILQIVNSADLDESYSSVFDPDESYDGEEEWSIGSVFSDGNLREFEQETEDEQIEDTALETFQNLDEAYDAVKTTKAGRAAYSKLEGLKAFSDRYDAEMPTDNKKTRSNWVKDYRDAGLIDIDLNRSSSRPEKEGELTEKGLSLIETTEDLDERVFSGLEPDAGEFYRKMFTQGYGDREANSGEKIQAFFLYGGGMGHTEVADELEAPESTVRDLAEYLSDTGIFTDDYMFTPEGRDLAGHVLGQLETVRPEEFEGGSVETELGQDEDDFFNDDGMLDI
jgi:transposase